MCTKLPPLRKHNYIAQYLLVICISYRKIGKRSLCDIVRNMNFEKYLLYMIHFYTWFEESSLQSMHKNALRDFAEACAVHKREYDENRKARMQKQETMRGHEIKSFFRSLFRIKARRLFFLEQHKCAQISPEEENFLEWKREAF